MADYGRILYISDYSELGYYVKEHFLNAKKDFLQINNIIDPNEKELMIMNQYDTLIFISYHESKKEIHSFCVHHTGNWQEAWGGKEEILSIAVPYLMKGSFLFLKEFGDLPVTMEVTHHGPTIDKNILFIEVTKQAYNEKRADLLVETALRLPEEKGVITFGVGGNHYCAKFNSYEEKDFAFGHIIPKYRELKENTFIQAIKKNFPKEAELILIDKKGTKKEQRDKAIEFAKKYNINYEII
ncbi:MAG: D-aminoacyl-tRNA deacylase [Nanoarchaeota archaeon]